MNIGMSDRPCGWRWLSATMRPVLRGDRLHQAILAFVRQVRPAAAQSIVIAAALSVCGCPPAGALAAEVTVMITDGSGKPVNDAVVALMPLKEQAPAAAGNAEASLDQVNKTFRPHVLAVQVGTRVTFPNSDNIRHEVYSFSEVKRFETKLYSGKAASPVLFDKPGVVVLGCNIHDSMRAYLYVVETPYFATTDAAGRGVLSAPTGQYSVRIWHPRYAKGRAPLSAEYQITGGPQVLPQTLDLADSEE